MKITIGIDLGTSSVKAIALSQTGQVLCEYSVDYPTYRSSLGYIEQSADDWWHGVIRCCQHIINTVPAHHVIGVGMCGQLNGFVLLDENDRIVQNAIIWLDQRGDKQARDLTHHFTDKFITITGNNIHSISVLSKLKWIIDTHPQVMQKTKKLMFVKDYITWKMTGAWGTDMSDASATNMMDMSTHRWSQEILEYCGIDVAILPPIYKSCHIAGIIHAKASTQTALPLGTPVVIGAGDVTSLSVGCGIDNGGVAGVTLGTAGHVVVVSSNPPKTNRDSMWRLSYVHGNAEVWLGLIISGGLSMVWIKNVLTALSEYPVSFEEFIEQTHSVPLGANGICFLPFLEGKASPHPDDTIRGVLHGLRSHHTHGDIITAVMEGVALNIKDCINAFTKMGVNIHTLRIAEGGSRSERWCQIIADVVQMPVEKIAQRDTSASGAAMIAMCTLTSDESIFDTIKAMVQIEKTYTPQKNTYNKAQQMYAHYTALAHRIMENQGG